MSEQLPPEENDKLSEQPWYSYQDCLAAVECSDLTYQYQIGSLFVVKMASANTWIRSSVFRSRTTLFYALKILEGGEASDRYRMALSKEPLQVQRTIRGLEDPGGKISTVYGHTAYRLNQFNGMI
jgi:hypothetical protein